MSEEQAESTETESLAAGERPGTLLRFARWLLLALPLAIFLWSGEQGVNFGSHWDEGHRVVDYSRAARNQTFLPDAYNYPSMTFAVGVFALLPEFKRIYETENEGAEYRTAIAEYVQSDEFMLRARRHFLLLSSATILWVFAALLAWGRKTSEALIAAMLVAGSFELNYHSRWVAPDAITMQFVALTIVALIAAYRRPEAARWMFLAAVGLGLATSTKYLAAILAVPITILLLVQRAPLRRYFGLAALSLVTFFAITPGALLEPTRFLEDILYEQQHYGFGHFGFTVEAGMDHFSRSSTYLLLHGASSRWWISALFTLLAVFGVCGAWRDSPRLTLALCSIPILYLTFISMQRVMFVRNLLFVMPLGAILSARGFGLLWDRFQRPALRGAFALIVAIALGINASDVIDAGKTVRDWTPEEQLTRLHGYMADESEHDFQLTPLVAQMLAKNEFAPLANTTDGPEGEAEFVVAFQNELLPQGYWPSNDPELFVRAFGPPSANYSYYSTWPQNVILVMERERAHEIASIYSPKDIHKIFADIEYTGIPNIPENQKPSPHTKHKPGHRKAKKPAKSEDQP